MTTVADIKDEILGSLMSETPDDGFVDQIFDEVAKIIRQRFGLSPLKAELLLADAKADAFRELGDIKELVSYDDVSYEVGRVLANLSPKKRAAPKKPRAKR